MVEVKVTMKNFPHMEVKQGVRIEDVIWGKEKAAHFKDYEVGYVVTFSELKGWLEAKGVTNLYQYAPDATFTLRVCALSQPSEQAAIDGAKAKFIEEGWPPVNGPFYIKVHDESPQI